MLLALWYVSLLLAAVSIAAVGVLIVVRLASERRGGAADLQRKALITQLFEWLSESDMSSKPPALEKASLRVLRDLASDLLTLLGGGDLERVVALLSKTRLPAVLCREVQRHNVQRAQRAAEMLQFFPSPRTVDALKLALQHGDLEVRLAAAISLAGLGVAMRLDELIDVLRIGGDQQSRLIVDLFRRLAPSQPDRLLDLVHDEKRILFVRLAALEALASTKDPTLVAPLSILAASADVNLAARALVGLGVLGHREAEPAVRAALASAHWQVRVQGAVAAGRLALGNLAEPLADLVNDDMWWVRYRAAEALLALGEIDLIRARSDKDGLHPSRGALLGELLKSEQRLRWAG